jgi:hypothetical protein
MQYHLFVLGFVIGIILSSSANVIGQQYAIPVWVKNNVKLWAENQSSNDGFASSMQYLMNVGVMHVPLQSQTALETKVPAWVKYTAGWWANGELSDSDFVNGIGYLITTGMIQFKTASAPSITNPTPPITNPTPPAINQTSPVTNPQNATGSQNIQNTPVAPTNTIPAVISTKILLLVSNSPRISQNSYYSFQAKVFDASKVNSNQPDQNIFNQNWGTLSGIRVQGYLTSSDNKTTFYTWNGLTNQFGLFTGQYFMRNEPAGNQVYFVHFNATASGMINDSKTYQFYLVNTGS